MRSRATSVVPSAVLYSAHAVLTRGIRLFTAGHVFVSGNPQKIISRYVSSPASNGQVAHLVAGWLQDATAAASMLLSTNELYAYMGHRPHWWRQDDNWQHGSDWSVVPDTISGTEAISYWRNVCMAMCFRMHDDDVEIVEVDLRPGLYNGSNPMTSPSRCRCYAYDDLSKLNRNGTSLPSHAAPNDIVMANFMSTASLVNHYEGTNIVDSGLLYRRFINTYAVHRDLWDELFVPEQQSTIFYALALEAEYAPSKSALSSDSNSTYYTSIDSIRDLNGCLRECAVHSGALEKLTARMDASSMIYEGESGLCICTTTNWLDLAKDASLEHNSSRPTLRTYRIKFCPGVAGASSRSVVYRKHVTGTNAVCMGMPVRCLPVRTT